jgi:hypothetical protein
MLVSFRILYRHARSTERKKKPVIRLSVISLFSNTDAVCRAATYKDTQQGCLSIQTDASNMKPLMLLEAQQNVTQLEWIIGFKKVPSICTVTISNFLTSPEDGKAV